ncbi:MAG: DUF3791 domain-containing protein [Fibrobacteraceae bacterium]|nr:DUF3791 domain-containing protein [Fibrobacteraceae bacterium]
MNKESFEFTIYMIHACANKWNKLPSEVFKKLNESACIKNLLVPFFDILHTQSTEYVVNDIESYLQRQGVAI